MKHIIHVNQHAIRRNTKTGERNPVLTVKTYKSNTYGHAVKINGPCILRYEPDKPLSCGARVWIETEAPVEVDWLGISPVYPSTQEMPCSPRPARRVKIAAS